MQRSSDIFRFSRRGEGEGKLVSNGLNWAHEESSGILVIADSESSGIQTLKLAERQDFRLGLSDRIWSKLQKWEFRSLHWNTDIESGIDRLSPHLERWKDKATCEQSCRWKGMFSQIEAISMFSESLCSRDPQVQLRATMSRMYLIRYLIKQNSSEDFAFVMVIFRNNQKALHDISREENSGCRTKTVFPSSFSAVILAKRFPGLWPACRSRCSE
jgi:hypothetical protein